MRDEVNEKKELVRRIFLEYAKSLTLTLSQRERELGLALFLNRLEGPFTNCTCITLEAPCPVKTPAFDRPM